MHNIKVIPLGIAILGVLAGCDNGSSPPTEASSYSVTAIDGYLNGARVWLDLNRNFELDDGEPNAVTGEGGVAELDVTGVDNPEQYPVVVQAIAGQTTDEDQGVVTENYVMSAPAGETAVTPLSTIVHNVLEQNPSLTKSEATQQVATELGIASDDVLGDFIAGGASKAKYAAEQIVSLGVLPQEPAELKQAATSTDSASSKFKIIVAAANEDIKAILDTVSDDQSPQEIEDDLSSKDAPVKKPDADGDGVHDDLDAFDDDPNEWVDEDDDGLGDNLADEYPNDTDNDGYNNDVDQYPTDNTRAGDDDEDGFDNLDDEFPNDATKAGDSDGDGVDSVDDWAPENPDEWEDSDNDGTGNNGDTDDDNDLVLDDVDNCPLVSNEDQADSDNDGIGDVCDEDNGFTWDDSNWDEATWQ